MTHEELCSLPLASLRVMYRGTKRVADGQLWLLYVDSMVGCGARCVGMDAGSYMRFALQAADITEAMTAVACREAYNRGHRDGYEASVAHDFESPEDSYLRMMDELSAARERGDK